MSKKFLFVILLSCVLPTVSMEKRSFHWENLPEELKNKIVQHIIQNTTPLESLNLFKNLQLTSSFFNQLEFVFPYITIILAKTEVKLNRLKDAHSTSKNQLYTTHAQLSPDNQFFSIGVNFAFVNHEAYLREKATTEYNKKEEIIQNKTATLHGVQKFFTRKLNCKKTQDLNGFCSYLRRESVRRNTFKDPGSL